jgi:hypothetical protein
MITTIINYVHDPIDKKITLSDFTSITLEQFIAIRNLTRDVYIYKLTDTTNFGGSVFANTLTYTVNSESFSDTDVLVIQYDDFNLESAVNIQDGGNSITIDGTIAIDQTTPGTTNKVTVGSDVVHVIVDSGVTTGLTDAQLRASAVPVSISTIPLATDAATENSLVLLRRITKLLETLAVVDVGQRQKIVLDAVTTGLTLSTVANNTAIAGMDREMYINIARNTHANAIRHKLTFS